MRYSKPTNQQLAFLLKRILPAAQAAGSVSGQPGLSGGVLRIESPSGPLVARPALPGVSLARQQRALRRAGREIGPRVLGCSTHWLVTEWLPGEVKPAITAIPQLADVLHRLHGMPLLGWRIDLLPVLQSCWQNAAPARRTPRWLRLLKQLRQQRMPGPLRLAPLHMDVHSGNIICQPGGMRLIDWEYAGDGDIALELAAVGVASESDRQALIADYARLSGINCQQLARQVNCWRPWTAILMASWYEQRWQQTGDPVFTALADAQWSALRR
ncbi:thiamine kinase [Shimwellia pseudoproteus]|uniref:thiamine kinase n=1 Tax=Shimwellia pseudoproteus TaxID=570012 RepID=UPI0018EB40C7|nr:thiamine kinase [Shimwellia pseudoproteus]MBJ3815476.1 thiamine kinase [Shimwellia pseudoproteus]